MDVNLSKMISEVEGDEHILGLILLGSRGKGFENQYSDYDLLLIIGDEKGHADYEKLFYYIIDDDNFDLTIKTLKEFEEYAAWGSADSWDRYDYAHYKIWNDKTNGVLEEIMLEKGSIPREHQKEFIINSLHGYINGVFRSVKCMRNNNKLGAHFEAVSSLPFLLDAIFALELRHKPFFGYFEYELEKYPLDLFESQSLILSFREILKSADLVNQQELFGRIRREFIEQGYKEVFDSWEGKDLLILEYSM